MEHPFAGQLEVANNGYAGIIAPDLYVNDRYHGRWTLKRSLQIEGVPVLLQRQFENGKNNCTLTSITAIFRFYRDHGYTNIPDDVTQIQEDVREIAFMHHFKDEKGTPPTQIATIITKLWKRYGYDGRGSSRYLWKWSTFERELKAGRPFVLNMANGFYKNHSVTGIGYLQFEKRGFPDVILLAVLDNRSKDVRYIDFNEFNFWGSITRVHPPATRP
ncbi:C39 family peptidase [Exiguobacterium sp. AT1b]|uniref:C39 family peptidase n=1 Tax=Exiguobacterium sp. (strain ATCC BAA-1283 / AT1b) TaxID=360911 RepID=UPI00093D5FF4|nr:C39 family peptidase [Exiguobacterium sp. AT1b]